ncbi:DUF4432 family protein [Pararhizobium sp. BT-229]|uniref:DUF4432 family protein n=1 Tax=Pararhizobium sp. BT-229 TaxID=2986923 RepID=UPI0021F7EDE2|nr:DUF4432 family protein [Pararhizobium sp. BT-229]MCV9961055.1 DUF4432 family protein [Pararhizobium sp. BT-229]
MPITISGGDAQGDFLILLDRQSALDIGAFVVDGVDISPGTAIPSDGDRRIDHALQGFFFTCGPDHIRHPEAVEGFDDGRTFPLHGSLCGTPVSRTEMSGPDEPRGCFGETEVRLANGGTALVSRRWRIGDGESEVLLPDRVTNTGLEPFAPMLMYHMNIGGRLLGNDTHISGTMFGDEQRPWRFGDGESAHFCVPAAPTARDGWAEVTLGPFEALAGRSLTVRFSTATLPFLQMWRCQRGSADVISIEPVSHRIAKRSELAAAGDMPMLAPGETIDYAVAFRIR